MNLRAGPAVLPASNVVPRFSGKQQDVKATSTAEDDTTAGAVCWLMGKISGQAERASARVFVLQ